VYLEILLSLATVTIFSIFALRPTLLTIAELIREIEAKNDTIDIMDSKIQDLSKAQLLSDQQQVNLSLLQIAIPEEPSPDIFARQIEALTQKHQTPLNSFTIGKTLILGEATSKTSLPQEAEDTTTQEVLPEELNFSVQTKVSIINFTNSSNFLSEMEKLRRPVGINSFNFSSTENKQDEEKQLIFTITGYLPYFKTEINK